MSNLNARVEDLDDFLRDCVARNDMLDACEAIARCFNMIFVLQSVADERKFREVVGGPSNSFDCMRSIRNMLIVAGRGMGAAPAQRVRQVLADVI